MAASSRSGSARPAFPVQGAACLCHTCGDTFVLAGCFEPPPSGLCPDCDARRRGAHIAQVKLAALVERKGRAS